MVIHFNSQQIAETHLVNHCWTQTRSGRWVSYDKTCAAEIRPHAGVVVIQYWEIEPIEA